MKERPILFSAPMVRALLNGHKTQTRRMVKPQPRDGEAVITASPYGQPGDRLWVKESWRSAAGLDHFTPSQLGQMAFDTGHKKPCAPIEYQADRSRHNWATASMGNEAGRIRSAIHMPRWASRLRLEIVAVRVERLHDIHDADAMAEGMLPNGSDGVSGVECYRRLFETINGDGSWVANPWVWVVEFRTVTA